ncbi:UNVERIFIED_CONTAM: hypothetical protein K2H54_055630 [Gekko kuhli]
MCSTPIKLKPFKSFSKEKGGGCRWPGLWGSASPTGQLAGGWIRAPRRKVTPTRTWELANLTACSFCSVKERKPQSSRSSAAWRGNVGRAHGRHTQTVCSLDFPGPMAVCIPR